MSLLTVAVISAVFLLIAYRLYGPILQRFFDLDDSRPTPAVIMKDDVDYIPIEPKFLIGQHFSAIAAAGPIVGPILAGVMFGWLPAIIWILLGAVIVGGVHDMSALVASIRHRAANIAEIVRKHMSHRSYLLFLAFIWLTLIYIIVAFTDITASSFVGSQTLENGQIVRGGGIATSSLLYLLLPIVMGLLLRYTKLSLGPATVIFLPLVLLTVWMGQYFPLDIASILGVSDQQAHRIWDVFILLYCLIAAVVPMWLLLQPRGHLGGYFLGFFLLVGSMGMIFGDKAVSYPAFKGWETIRGDTVFPLLFITVACGACSGFHSLVASGTTSKQLKKETDAKSIGYGTMLLESMVAVIALSCVMMLAVDSPLAGNPKPNFIFANGIGGYLPAVGVPMTFAISIMLMAFTTFVYDTLDICTRLGRYIVQELTGWQDRKGAWIGTVLTAGVPLIFLMPSTGDGKPAWMTFWGLFGASNQLLAALTLLGVTVWLWKTKGTLWAFVITGIPCLFMYVMSFWALVIMISRSFQKAPLINPVSIIGSLLLALSLLMLIEAVLAFSKRDTLPGAEAVATA